VNQIILTKRLASDDMTAHEKAASLTNEYQLRRAQMGDAIQRVIENSKVAHVEIFTRNKSEQEVEKLKREELEKKRTLDKDLLPDKAPLEGEKLADGFVRSQRNMALRIKYELNNQVAEVEQQKVDTM
jgi:hypothetical protein